MRTTPLDKLRWTQRSSYRSAASYRSAPRNCVGRHIAPRNEGCIGIPASDVASYSTRFEVIGDGGVSGWHARPRVRGSWWSGTPRGPASIRVPENQHVARRVAHGG
jgi:hypothetical protein